MKHLLKNRCRDESDVWCDPYLTTGDITSDPAECDCRQCITTAAGELRRYTSGVISRLRELRPNKDSCPFEFHADDCACHGNFTTTISWKP